MAIDNRSSRVLENIGRSGLGKDLAPYLPRQGMTGGLIQPKTREEYSREVGDSKDLKDYFDKNED